MHSLLREILVGIGGRLPLYPVTHSPSTTVLMYHGVSRAANEYGFDASAFEAQIQLLSSHVKFVRANDVNRLSDAPGDQLRAALTFDDGYANNAEVVVPILRKYRVPATFFICHRNTELRKPAWFTYLKALDRYYPGTELRFLEHTLDLTPKMRAASVKFLESLFMAARPHPSAMYKLIEEELPPLESFVSKAALIDEFYGMTLDQIRELAADPLFDLGAHTMDHPLLPLCDDVEMERQIAENQEWLAGVCGYPIDSIAYPNGEATAEVINFCRSRGFLQGYSVRHTVLGDTDLEIRRAGIYYPSLMELRCKVQSTELVAAMTQFPRHLRGIG